MKIKFAGQPFADQENLYDFMAEALADDSIREITLVVAWAKRSGLLRLQEAIEDFSAAGGRSLIIVGIDEGGATEQGLRLCIDLFDKAYIFHDPSWRTFHPKLYFANGEASARLLVGSNNLTAGGIFFNYEAAVSIELDLADPADGALRDDVQRFIERLIAETKVCLPLTEDLLATLIANPRIRIGSEDAKKTVPADDVPEDTDELAHQDDTDIATSPFGKPQELKRADPHPVQGVGAPAPQGPPRRPAPARPAGAQPTPPRRSPVTAPNVIRRWTKKLAKSDAQQPAAGSNPTGNLRLTKAGHPINWRTFFRDQLFAPVSWTATTDNWGNPIEVADVDFVVELDSANKGTYTLRVDHAPHREAGQANHTTILHWDDLISELQRTNFVDYYVVIERMSDDTYRLSVTRADPGAIL